MDQSIKPCARCGVNPRNSSSPSYCIPCKRANAREAAERRGSWKRPQEKCSRCGEARTGRHLSYCPPCASAYRAEQPCPKCGSSKAGPNGTKSPYCVPCYRDHRLRKTYGISAAEFDALLSGQGGRCAICRGEESDRQWHVDHCHDTGNIRGVLCAKCNMGLGMFGESSARLSAAADYLAR